MSPEGKRRYTDSFLSGLRRSAMQLIITIAGMIIALQTIGRCGASVGRFGLSIAEANFVSAAKAESQKVEIIRIAAEDNAALLLETAAADAVLSLRADAAEARNDAAHARFDAKLDQILNHLLGSKPVPGR